VLLFLSGGLWADDPTDDMDARAAIQSIYAATLTGMRDAKTKEDIARVVNGIDVPEWVSLLYNGQTMVRAQAIRELEGLLAIAPEKRPEFRMDILYWNETAAGVRVVYWAYGERGNELAGSMARDSWARTPSGWRRLRHEKFLPDRPLVVDGKAVVTPPVGETIRTQ